MAVTARPYQIFLRQLGGNLAVDMTYALKVCLFTPDYVPDYTVHETFGYMSGWQIDDESSAGGYVFGGQPITSASWDPTSAGDGYQLTGDDVTFTINNGSFRFAIIYRNLEPGGFDTPLLGCIDLGETVTVVNDTFTLAMDTAWISLRSA